MHLKINRFLTTDKSTIGTLSINNQFECYTLEDTFNEPKIYGETRIPAGIYQITLRTFGGFHQRYCYKFGKDHFGMLEICGVSDFQHVLIHIGNSYRDTEGCILLGKEAGEDYIKDSTLAYRHAYRKIARALTNNEEVTLEIV